MYNKMLYSHSVLDTLKVQLMLEFHVASQKTLPIATVSPTSALPSLSHTVEHNENPAGSSLPFGNP